VRLQHPPEAVYIVGVTLEIDAIAEAEQIDWRACIQEIACW
jgi:hypothetical protein